MVDSPEASVIDDRTMKQWEQSGGKEEARNEGWDRDREGGVTIKQRQHRQVRQPTG